MNEFTCKGVGDSVKGHSETSEPLRLTVSGKPRPILRVSPSWLNPGDSVTLTSDVILESPVHPVTEGDHVTLRCKHQNPSRVSKVDFYKDGGLLQNGTSREMTIPAVSKSHEGLYRCGYSDGEESPESWLLVRVVASFLQRRLLFGLLVASPYMLATILLVMIHRQRQAKSPAEDQPDYDDVGEDPETSPPPVAAPSSAP
ncbi:Fc receptor-like A [Aplochiton taeniatus]